MNDPAEDITDALVEYVQNQNLSLVASVRNTENPLGELEFENTNLTILFHPAEEASEKVGRGKTFIEYYTIAMLVVRKLDNEFTRSKLAKFTREIKLAVRGEKMAGYCFSEDQTPVKFDAQQRRDLQQFMSVSHFVYYGYAACE